MSVPAFIFLMPFCLVKKPVPGEWPQVLGMDKASDFDIMMMTRQIAPSTFELFILSGFFSFAYNIIQFKIVHELSPSATAFGGNIIIWAAVLGNVAAFSYYSYLQILAKQAKAAEEAAKSEDKAENDKSQAMLLNEENKDEAALGA